MKRPKGAALNLTKIELQKNKADAISRDSPQQLNYGGNRDGQAELVRGEEKGVEVNPVDFHL